MADLFSVEAYSFASRFNLREATAYFPPAAATRTTKTRLMVEWAPDSIAVAYDFGALVFINVPSDVRSAILGTFEAKHPREPHAPLREDVLVEVRPGSTIEVTFDRVVVPELSPTGLEVIALVIAQSVSLDYYDEDVQAILDDVGQLGASAAKKGRPTGRTHELVRFVGMAIASHAEVITAISLLDKPALTWEDESADRLYDKLRHHLEIPDRFKALESKLVTGRESLQLLLELISTRRMIFLEASIVVLIVVEIALTLIQLH